jgi:hypothetical protein
MPVVLVQTFGTEDELEPKRLINCMAVLIRGAGTLLLMVGRQPPELGKVCAPVVVSNSD